MRKLSLWTGVLGAAIALTMVGRPASAVQETKIGVTSASNLTTTGFPPVSPEHLLKIGVEVVGDERVITTKDGRAQLLFLDHSALTIGPNSNLVLDKFVYDPDAGVGELAFSATKGIFRLVGGRISKKTPVTIKTFSGTIGIRGGIAMVSIQEGRPVEATFLFGEDMTVESEGQVVTATRPGSMVTFSPGNILDPVILTADQISATVQQLEQTPGKTTESAVLVFQQEVKDAALGALAEPAAGPGPTPPPPAPPVGPSVNTGDIISDSTEDTTSAVIAPPAPAPALIYSGRIKREAFANSFFGTSDGNPAINIPFKDATVNGVFDATLSSTQQLTINVTPGPVPFAADSTTTPFTGILSGQGFLTADGEFIFYQLTDQSDNIRTLAWAGVPTPLSAFPSSGVTFYELQPDFVLTNSNVPFVNGASGGGLTVPNPVEAIIDWDLGLFAGAAIVIDGADTAQQSAASVFFGPLVDLGDPQTADIIGLIRGGSFRSANDTTATISAASHFRLSRDGDGALGNGFFGSANPDYFVLERDGGLSERVVQEGTFSFNRGYSPNVIGLATPDVLGPRTDRTLNGFAGGLSRRFDGIDVIGAFMFGNTNGDPSDISINTDATTGTLAAVFDVQKIGALNASDDHLVASFGSAFGGAGPSAFFDDDSFGAFESATPAQFTTVTNPAINPFLVGGQLFRSNGTTGAVTSLGYRFTSNSSDFGTVFPIDLVGDSPDAGFVPREYDFELQPGDNVFNFPNSGGAEVAFYGLGLFFNDTGVTFNPAITAGTVTGDLVAFTTGDAIALGASTGFGIPAAGTLTRAFDSFTGAVAYSGNSSFTLPGGSEVTITNFKATNDPPAGAAFTATFTITVVSSGPTGPAVNGTNLYMVTSEAFQSNAFPGAASQCACQFLKWGFWGGEIRFTNGDRERIHLANWIAGDNIASGAILDGLPAGATAIYNGHLIGTVLNTGAVYQAMGGFGMNFDFDNPTDSTINVTGFDSVDYNANVTGLTNGIYQATGPDASALGRTMNFTGAFFGGGGDPVAETGGQFNVDGGPDYSASGIFAGAK